MRYLKKTESQYHLYRNLLIHSETINTFLLIDRTTFNLIDITTLIDRTTLMQVISLDLELSFLSVTSTICNVLYCLEVRR